MRSLTILLLISSLARLAVAHPGGDHDDDHAPLIEHTIVGDKKPWTSDKPRFAPKDFQFVVVSDNTGTPRPGIFREAMEKADLLQPAFIISVGDLIEGYVDTKEELNVQWDEFMTYLEPLTVPFFFAPGNHDVGRQLWHDVYLERVGPSYYYFLYQDVLFLILDTNDGENRGTGYSEEQLQWAKGVLDAHTDVRWTYVIQHKPFWLSHEDEWKRAEPLFAGRQHTFFAGHVHNYSFEERGNIQYVTLGTSGGGSRLRGEAYGEFDHVMWVTARDEGPKMASLALDGIQPVDFRTTALMEELSAFRSGRVVQSSPVVIEGDTFATASWDISVTNPWDKPLRFKGFVEADASLRVSPSSISFIVPPDSAVTKRISVAAEPALFVDQIQPIALHWTGIYDTFNAEPIQFNDVHRLFADGLHHVPRIEGIAVDGKLDDWGVLPFEMKQPGQIYTNELAWKGMEDATFRFGLAHDDTTLFVAMEVDDDVVDGGGVKLWQDFAVVYARAAGEDPEKTPMTEESVVAIVEGPDLSPEERAGYERNGSKHLSAELDCISAFDASAERITYEFSIPLAALKRISGAETDHIQFNIGINDYDPSDARLGVSLITWRPGWATGAHFPASGIFALE